MVEPNKAGLGITHIVRHSAVQESIGEGPWMLGTYFYLLIRHFCVGIVYQDKR